MRQTKKVIIVDDYKPVRDLLRQFAESIPLCDVAGETYNGNDAIELISSIEPDIVTLDIQLPDISGIEVLCRIQEIIKNTTIIVLSNHTSDLYKSKCMELGADYYLDKTKDFEQLFDIMESLCH
ncbi:MAG: response regulator transcription factor [Candidatus Thiodiazotropha sp.]